MMGIRSFVYDLVKVNLLRITTAGGYSQDITATNIKEFFGPDHRWNNDHYPIIEIMYPGEELRELADQSTVISMVLIIRLHVRNSTLQTLLEFIDDVEEVLTTTLSYPTGYDSLTNVEVLHIVMSGIEAEHPSLEANHDAYHSAMLTVEIAATHSMQDHAQY